MAASNDRNKLTAGGSFGDVTPLARSEPDNAEDRRHDGEGIPQTGMANNNKFSVGGRFGDTAPFIADFDTNDFSKDSAGLPNVNQGEMTSMDLSLEGNKFPRQTGHDSLTPEEAQLT